MLVEDLLIGAVILFFVGGIIAPLAKGRRVFWRRDKKDPLEAAKLRKEAADRKLEALQAEKEAVQAETKYEREVNELYLESEKEKQRGN